MALAPTRLTPIAGDEAIGVTHEGQAVKPTFYFFQMIQRILSYLGSPGGGPPPSTVLTPISMDHPIGTLADGTEVFPSMYFGQTMQRILSYIGSPGGLPPAPTRLTPIAGDQPIGRTLERLVNDEKHPPIMVFPTPYFFQMIQRILSYLGVP